RHDPASLAQAAVTVEWFEPNRSDAADPNCRPPTRKFTAAAIGDRSAPRKDETRRGVAGRRALDEMGLSMNLSASLDSGATRESQTTKPHQLARKIADSKKRLSFQERKLPMAPSNALLSRC